MFPTAGHEDERAHTLERSIMKNWYKRPVTKGILLLLAHVMAAAAVISLVIIIVFSGNLGKAEFFKLSSTPYEESDSFNNLVSNAVWDVMSSITLKNNFETDGKYNPSKLVDIVDLGKNGQITGAKITSMRDIIMRKEISLYARNRMERITIIIRMSFVL